MWRDRQQFLKQGLNRTILSPIKPIVRFQAKRANDLRQINLMGKRRFPKFGPCHLILLKDDCFRYLPAGTWVPKTLKLHVFACLYQTFMRSGLLHAILCDKGSPFTSTDPRGSSDCEEHDVPRAALVPEMSRLDESPLRYLFLESGGQRIITHATAR